MCLPLLIDHKHLAQLRTRFSEIVCEGLSFQVISMVTPLLSFVSFPPLCVHEEPHAIAEDVEGRFLADIALVRKNHLHCHILIFYFSR